MKFHENPWKYQEFMEFHEIPWKRGRPRSRLENLLNSYRNSMDFRCPSWLHIPRVHWFSRNFRKIHRNLSAPWSSTENRGFVEMLALRWRAPQNHWNSLGNIDVFASGPGKLDFHKKSWDFCECCYFSRKSRNHEVSAFVVKFQLPRPRRRKRWYSQGNIDDSGVRFAAEVNISTKTWNFMKFHNSQEITRTSWKSCISQKISILQWRTPQNHQYSLRNINVFASAARAAPVSRKNWKFQKVPEGHGSRENFRKSRNSAKTRKAETATGPPNGPPTRPRSGPPVIIRP